MNEYEKEKRDEIIKKCIRHCIFYEHKYNNCVQKGIPPQHLTLSTIRYCSDFKSYAMEKIINQIGGKK